ncbi:MAG: hypothetical protein KAR11_01910 [Phycisphaerae bacterium]|nr:hypothetical protein [Phycisphaerae bacterium]
MERSCKNVGILGVGLDNDDEHVRVTKGDNFHLVGGSNNTHECMQEKCIKFNEKLSERGKTMEQLEPTEFIDIAEECEMKMLKPPKEKEK